MHVAPNVQPDRLGGHDRHASIGYLDGHLPFSSAGRVLPSTNRSTHAWLCHACACLGMQYSSVLHYGYTLSELQFSRRTAAHRIWRRPECILPIIRFLNSQIPSSILYLQRMQCAHASASGKRSEQLSVRRLFSDCIQPNLPVKMQLSWHTRLLWTKWRDSCATLCHHVQNFSEQS